MESLDAAGKHPKNQDPNKQFAIAQARRLLLDAKVEDPGPKVNKSQYVPKRPSIQTEVSHLDSIIRAYENQIHTPEFVTQTHQTIWQARGEVIGATYDVTHAHTHKNNYLILKK